MKLNQYGVWTLIYAFDDGKYHCADYCITFWCKGVIREREAQRLYPEHLNRNFAFSYYHNGAFYETDIDPGDI